VRILGGAQDPWLLGAALDLSFPVGHAFSDSSATGQNYYLGNSSPVTVGIRGIFDGAIGPVQLGANLRGVFILIPDFLQSFQSYLGLVFALLLVAFIVLRPNGLASLRLSHYLSLVSLRPGARR